MSERMSLYSLCGLGTAPPVFLRTLANLSLHFLNCDCASVTYSLPEADSINLFSVGEDHCPSPCVSSSPAKSASGRQRCSSDHHIFRSCASYTTREWLYTNTLPAVAWEWRS